MRVPQLLPFVLLAWFAVPTWSQPAAKKTSLRPFVGTLSEEHRVERGAAVRAVFIARSDPETRARLSLYAFDDHGNCVAWDDAGDPAVLDRAAVAFVAERTGRYYVEARNLSQQWADVEFKVNVGQ
jgi:hypothetical protein